jgi:hypothetical protein
MALLTHPGNASDVDRPGRYPALDQIHELDAALAFYSGYGKISHDRKIP